MEEQVGIKTNSEVQADRMKAMQDAIKKARKGKGLDDSKAGPSIYGSDDPVGEVHNGPTSSSAQESTENGQGWLYHLDTR